MNFKRWTGKTKHTLGLNRTVVTLSIARMTDAIGNSILFVIIPLYVKQFAIDINISLPVMVGLLVSAYGIAASIIQPLMGAAIDKLGYNKQFIQAGLVVLAGVTITQLTTSTAHKTRGSSMADQLFIF